MAKKKCCICHEEDADSFYQKKEICQICFRRIKNKRYSQDYLQTLGFIVNYKKRNSFLDKYIEVP